MYVSTAHPAPHWQMFIIQKPSCLAACSPNGDTGWFSGAGNTASWDPLHRACGRRGERSSVSLMEDRSDAVIVLPGGIGTYEEFFEILTLKQLGQTSRAIAILNTNHYYDPMLAFLQNTVDQKFMSSNCMDLFFIHDDPKQLLDYIDRYVPVSGNLDRLGDYTK